ILVGLGQARSHGTPWDAAATAALVAAHAVPSFLGALILLVLFAGGRFWSVFPVEGLTSPGASDGPRIPLLADLAWHAVLPVATMASGTLAGLSLLTRSALIDERTAAYFTALRARGVGEWRALWRHALLRALIPVAGSAAATVAYFLSGTVLVETVF